MISCISILGDGTFAPAHALLPPVYANGCCVAPADFDSDGDLDLFVGTRSEATGYGRKPSSFLFENDGNGRFTDITTTHAPGLIDVGMVTAVVWSDITGNGAPDLVLVGEWMPVTVFANSSGLLHDVSDSLGLSPHWRIMAEPCG